MKNFIQRMFLQDSHLGSSPPKIGIKNKNVSISPMPRMLFNALNSNSPIIYSVVDRIIRI